MNETEPVKIRLPRGQWVLCATPNCENRALARPPMAGSVYCPACTEKQAQQRSE